MQHGGSSTELYPHLFDEEEHAKRYIEDAGKTGAYHCDGPFFLDGVAFTENVEGEVP